VSFVTDLAANAVGGVVTAVVLGTWATRFAALQQVRRHNDRVADLIEDNRRWFRDRDAQLGREFRRLEEQRAQSGLTSEGVAAKSREIVQRQVLVEYRNEMTLKRRRYADLWRAEDWPHRLVRRRRCKPSAF
jgi:hypothetical protein